MAGMTRDMNSFTLNQWQVTVVRPYLVRGVLVCAMALASVQARADETFTATATVKGTGRSAPLTIKLKKFSSDGDRDDLVKALKKGGTAAARDLLAKKSDAGSVLLGTNTTPVKYAYDTTVGPNRVITIVTAKPIHFVGADQSKAKLKIGYDLGLLHIDLSTTPGVGEAAPAAKVAVNAKDDLIIEDYGAEQIVLTNIIVKK
jgi:hypothetical protein